MTAKPCVHPSPKPFRLLAVIVLYKVTPWDSVTFRTLEAARNSLPPDGTDLKILLYDNTPGGIDLGKLPDGVQYELASRNRGLAGAYNRALEIAHSDGFEWLLTLDQDTTLPPGFLLRMTEVGRSFAEDTSVAAVVPQLSDHGKLLSPVSIRFARVAQFPRGFVGFSLDDTHAYNSGSMLRVSILLELGGFNTLFWLDFLDAWLYTHLNLLDKRIFVAGDLQIEHELSLLDCKKRLSPARFRNFLQAESAFCDLYRGGLEGLALTGRLWCRLFLIMKQGSDPAINKAILECLKNRILRSRASRLRDWKREMEAHDA